MAVCGRTGFEGCRDLSSGSRFESPSAGRLGDAIMKKTETAQEQKNSGI
jgi:hypothetical protein